MTKTAQNPVLDTALHQADCICSTCSDSQIMGGGLEVPFLGRLGALAGTAPRPYFRLSSRFDLVLLYPLAASDSLRFHHSASVGPMRALSFDVLMFVKHGLRNLDPAVWLYQYRRASGMGAR